jgi:hypothetical protein
MIFRNQLSDHDVSELIAAIDMGDHKLLNSVASELDLLGLDADYQGVVVDPSYYDPNEIGIDYSIEILRDVEEQISGERAKIIEKTGKLTDAELSVLKKYITEEMEQNSGGEHSTLWFANVGDDTGDVVIAFYQFEDGEREFIRFSKNNSTFLDAFTKDGTEIV